MSSLAEPPPAQLFLEKVLAWADGVEGVAKKDSLIADLVEHLDQQHADKARLDQATLDEACDGESDLFSSLQKWKTVDPAEAISYFASNDLSDIDRKILSMHKDAVSAIPNIKGVSDAVVSLAKLKA